MPIEPNLCYRHQSAATPLHILMVIIFGFLALVSIGGGIVAIIWNAAAKTEFKMFGVHLSTGHVGVAFVGIGLVTAFFTMRSVLKSQRDLASLPPDSTRKRRARS